MIYDFGLLKGHIKELIDSFDHAVAFWDKDNAEYIAFCKQFSARWISLPVSPSAEQFSRVIFVLVDSVLKQTVMQNGEADVSLHSIIVHETITGYAQCFRDDVENPRMGLIQLDEIVFSEQVCSEWSDHQLFEKLKQGEMFVNPIVKPQVL
jgi:6-pyruvoyltetrahydropterin/6-carboxytetrahydropterin synthase